MFAVNHKIKNKDEIDETTLSELMLHIKITIAMLEKVEHPN